MVGTLAARWLGEIQLGVRTLLLHKLRSSLTMLGMVFGVSSVIAMLAVGEGESVRVGAPFVSGAQVKGTVLKHGRGPKEMTFKLRRRKHYQKTQGHRQSYTEVRIDDIVA